MIPHARRAFLLIAFFLLASAATAHAECAWGLWSRFSREDWFINGTLQSKVECLKYLERAAGRPLGDTERATGTATTLDWAKTGTWVGLCIPDTVDPRGPKGK